MWHNIWQDGEWSETDAVVSGLGGTGFDPYDARAAIVQGNELLITWRTDPGNSKPGVWYSTTKLNTPNILAQPLPDSEVGKKTEEGESLEQQLTSGIDPLSENNDRFVDSVRPPTNENPGRPLLMALVSSTLIVMIAFLARRVRDYITD
jgi:hypothetical protein